MASCAHDDQAFVPYVVGLCAHVGVSLSVGWYVCSPLSWVEVVLAVGDSASGLKQLLAGQQERERQREESREGSSVGG